MGQKGGWISQLLKELNECCEGSPLLARLSQDHLALETGRWICQELWPFIQELPGNISAVRERLPIASSAARSLLGQLADDERHYQRLFVKQCQLAGVSEADMASHTASPTMKTLCVALKHWADSGDYIDGIYAIVTAELAATAFSRYALPHYERYFSAHADNYPPGLIDEGLEWLRLHARPQTRHALWLKRMIEDVRPADETGVPEPVATVLNAIAAFWQGPEPGRSTRGDATTALCV